MLIIPGRVWGSAYTAKGPAIASRCLLSRGDILGLLLGLTPPPPSAWGSPRGVGLMPPDLTGAVQMRHLPQPLIGCKAYVR